MSAVYSPHARPLLSPGLTKSLGSSHFIAVQTETQRGQVTYPRSHSGAWI